MTENYQQNANCLKMRLRYYDNGKLATMSFFMNGLKHRIDGPAFQKWDEDGKLYKEDYYLDNMKVSKERHLIRTRDIILSK